MSLEEHTKATMLARTLTRTPDGKPAEDLEYSNPFGKFTVPATGRPTLECSHPTNSAIKNATSLTDSKLRSLIDSLSKMRFDFGEPEPTDSLQIGFAPYKKPDPIEQACKK